MTHSFVMQQLYLFLSLKLRKKFRIKNYTQVPPTYFDRNQHIFYIGVPNLEYHLYDKILKYMYSWTKFPRN